MKNIFDISGKVVVLTGAAGLLGTEISKALIEHNAVPVLIDLDEEKLLKLYENIHKTSGKYPLMFAADICNEAEMMAVKTDVLSKFGRVDSLINNAARNPKVENGLEELTRLENFPSEEWVKDLEVGLFGSFVCSKIFGQAIQANEEGGTIVNVVSDLGIIAPNQNLYKKNGLPEHSQPVKPVTYSVVKFGLVGLTKYLSTYWAHKNVRCNAICPGGIENGQDENFLEKIHELIPLGRMAKTNEYNATILWMLSDGASYLNGATISIDGGRTAW